ncbi:MAG: hypothetical protein AAF376_07220 [Pseudomonadota bacterium]
MTVRIPLLRAAALVVPVAMAAQTSPSFDYPTCMAEAMGQFEADLAAANSRAPAPNVEIVSRDAVQYCGTLAVVACDRSAAPLACQDDLADRQQVLRRAILNAVPDPAEVTGLDPVWSDRLYPQLWAVAHGTSAGPDCAGADDVYVAWCRTWQANLKVSEAVILWQVARVLGAAPSGVEAGWIAPPSPMRPMERPSREGEETE